MRRWPGLSGLEAKTLVAIASFMDGEGQCFPSRKAIGERAGIPRMKSVSRCIVGLAEKGILTIERRRRVSSRYTILDGADSAPSRVLDGALSAPQDGALSAPHKLTTLSTLSKEQRAELEALAVKVFGNCPSRLGDWTSIHPFEAVKEAMHRTQEAGKRAVSYTQGILQRMCREGYEKPMEATSRRKGRDPIEDLY